MCELGMGGAFVYMCARLGGGGDCVGMCVS